MAFYTIYTLSATGGGLPGPPPVTLVQQAGFSVVEDRDVTEAYLRVARKWHESWARHEAQAREALGSAKFEGEQANRAGNVTAIESGSRKRCLVVAERQRRKP
jgi:hypothetical protein